MIAIRRATRQDANACVEILARLPEYFTDDTHAQMRAAVNEHLVWVAIDGDRIEGVVFVERRYLSSAEIVIAAVFPERQRAGIGTQLVDHALDFLRAERSDAGRGEDVGRIGWLRALRRNPILLGAPRVRAGGLHQSVARLGTR